MTTESEHVCPGVEAQVIQSRKLAEAETFGDEAAVEGVRAFGGLGGVLGDVGGDLAVGEVPASRDRPDVQLTPPCQGLGG